MASMKSSSAHLPVNQVVVHPLVLLSVVDHYNRVAKDTNKRVVGVLLGEVFKGRMDITNSYAVPFEEDSKDKTIWYFDHTYHEDMYDMFKKVNAKEKVLGWYSTGPKIRPADTDIHELLRRYTTNPIFVIIDVDPKDNLAIPTSAYLSVENVPEEKSLNRRTFMHIPTEIGAEEAEEVGVEHLLRSITDATSSSVAGKVQAKLASLKGLEKRMNQMKEYLENVVAGKLPVNHKAIYNIQNIFNLSPDLKNSRLQSAFAVKNNDNMLVIYLSSIIRSIVSLHDLINNKISYNRLVKEEEERIAKEEDEKLKQKADKERKEKEAALKATKKKEEAGADVKSEK